MRHDRRSFTFKVCIDQTGGGSFRAWFIAWMKLWSVTLTLFLSLSLSVYFIYSSIYFFIFLPRFTIAEKTFSVSFCKFWLFHLLCLITARWRSPSFVRFVWIFLFRNWKERHWKANRGSFSKSKLYKNKTNGFEQKQDLSISKQFIGNNGEKTANMTVQFCVI